MQYVQVNGNFYLNHQFLCKCYSGFGLGLNNPADEAIPDFGPIPAGTWEIIRWDDHHAEKGPVVAVLSPVGHNAHGRSAFLIHGDNNLVNHTASHGCIIMPREFREKIRASNDLKLEVLNNAFVG